MAQGTPINGLSSVNCKYISNFTIPQTQPAAVVQTNPIQNNDKKDKIKKAILGLAAAGGAIALGAGVYYLSKGKNPKLSNIDFDNGFAKLKGQTEGFTGTIKDKLQNGDKISLSYENGILTGSKRSGKVNFTKTYETVNGEKIVKKTAGNTTVETNITQLQKFASKTRIHSVEKLGNNRIKVNLIRGNKITGSAEMPEFLYHITSKTAMDSILQDGVLRISDNEQLKGLYLFDSENFIQHYASTVAGGKKRDLLSALFGKASRGNTGVPLANQELVVIKIPTEDLLKTGKIRIRTQEDFFSFQQIIKNVNKQTGKTFAIRDFCNEKTREEFRQVVLSNKLMEEKSLNDFMDDMAQKIHHGYSLTQITNLEKTNAIEYIFNKDVQLSDYPNIQTLSISPSRYLSSNGKAFDSTKAATIFRQAFQPLNQ